MSNEQTPKATPPAAPKPPPPEVKLDRKEAFAVVEKNLLDLSQPGVLADQFNRVKVVKALKALSFLK